MRGSHQNLVCVAIFNKTGDRMLILHRILKGQYLLFIVVTNISPAVVVLMALTSSCVLN